MYEAIKIQLHVTGMHLRETANFWHLNILICKLHFQWYLSICTKNSSTVILFAYHPHFLLVIMVLEQQNFRTIQRTFLSWQCLIQNSVYYLYIFWLDFCKSIIQGVCHADQLIPNPLTGHALYVRTLGNVFFLGHHQVGTETQWLVPVVYANLWSGKTL